MLVGGSYYALTLSANGTGTAAYMSLTPQSTLEISQGGVAFAPTAASATVVNIYPQTLQLQVPAGMVSAGVTIITNESHVAGALRVSPAVDVPVVVELWGSELLGTFTLQPGEESGAFNFPVNTSQALPLAEAAKITQRMPNA